MLKLEHVNKIYGERHALNDVNIAFPEHKTTVIVGPSGSGKSTLLRSLNLLERPESGLYHFDDLELDFSKAIAEKDILSIRRQTGMVFQSFNLFPHLSVLKNVTEAPIHVLKQSPAAATSTAKGLLAQVGLADKADQFPTALSGGQQQRVAIARALAMKPKYMFFDEPTSALDPELEADVLRVLLKLAQEHNSMIVVTHNMEFARGVADQIIFLEEGEILYSGDPKTFFTEPTERIHDFLSAMNFMVK
ncbi:amino acid ABC transporter ATP-binding protein [Loigolactobacillus coryniformis]|jgi:cystine transport system ATP-binding protein|uniref:Amino acid ABC transporter, ATP-binding protein n=3 Tax=Loigolactobacillus coryniformis TaxID=1610 RepID=J3ES53_9LACO|nr:amino acid ABC transporter ATP-binding protein [Loigolactobacillus coryniformis]MDT3390806.1 amino acid ABC transporter ATP-binding protein [Bacillota bacterium]OEH90926.1 arginine ABC transporter ATP-binding protein [Loigolactobacillus coryniformis subsp. coryniformis]RRG04811.1 MAG: amino acid ABC transporter ATP-binding protein [Lactobacillus sp.]ATO54681.1 arginine ABC transporter ATP-binding protein ArtP [Loigolactobacillus coryniformis subsp. coryniformis KCTC 3167 = DSM 20001]EJN5662